MNANVDDASIACPSDFSCFSPSHLIDMVPRDSLLSTIELEFEKGEKVIRIIGDGGMGKTVLLSQFLEINRENCISIFIDAVNKLSYCEENIVRDIYQQVSFYINKEDAFDVDYDVIDSRLLNSRMHLLQMALKKNRKKLFFVVDGLDGIPAEDDYIIESIMDLMPFASDRIHFLFSSKDRRIEKALKKQNSKEIVLPLLSYKEAKDILPALEADAIRDILRIFRGIPDRLIAIKRLLKQGLSIEDIIQNYSESNADLIRAEWEIAESHINANIELFGLITFATSPLSVHQVSEILEITDLDVVETLGNIGFLDESGGGIRYLSNGIRSYAETILDGVKVSSIQKIIIYLNRKPDSTETLSELAVYYGLVDNYPAIVEQVSNENISLLFSKTNSINETVRQIKIARHAANQISSEKDILRLAHAQAIFSGMTTSKLLESELRCYLNEGDIESALGLASTSKVVEERLQLLGIIAAHQMETDDSVDEYIVSQVKEDFARINPQNIGVERSVELALGLFSAFPELALSLINGMDSMDLGGGNKADYAFFRFSMEAIKKNAGSLDLILDGSEQLEGRKRDALDMLGFFKPGTPAEKIVSRLRKFEEPGDSIFILRNWIRRFPKDEGIYVLVETLLSLVVGSTGYHSNASLYADLMTAVQYLPKKQGCALISKIAPNYERLQRAGPTIDYIKMMSSVAVFEISNDIQTDTVQELIAFILGDIEDASIRLSALSLVSKLASEHEEFSNYCDFSQQKELTISSLVGGTAEHVSVIKDALMREVEVSLENAVSWASRLNTRPRRDHALSMVIEKHCKLGNVQSVDRICHIIRKIRHQNRRFIAFDSLLEFAVGGAPISKADLKRLIKLKAKIRNNFQLCRVNVSLLLIIDKMKISSVEQRMATISDLDTAWNGIDGEWNKIDIAYQIHNRLSGCCIEVAKTYKERAFALRKKNPVNSARTIASLVHSVDLAIRSFYFLCKNDIETANDRDQISALVEQIPGTVLRIKQYSRLASVYDLTNRTPMFEDMVEKHLVPNLEKLGGKYSRELAVSLYWSSPLIYIHSRDMFERWLKVISEDQYFVDSLITWAQKYLLTRCLLGDPFSSVKNHKYKLTFKGVEDQLYLTRHLKEDSRIYSSLSKIVDIVLQGRKSHSFSATQIDFIVAEIERIIDTQFEGGDFITHSGYKICCKIMILVLKGVKSNTQWEDIVNLVSTVPVDSDKVFVLGDIVRSMPSQMHERRKQLLRLAVELTDRLPSGLDKIERYQLLAEVGQSFDRSYVKDFVRRAVLVSTSEDTEAYEEKRLRLIDSLYSMDKEYATGLSAIADTDPARKKIIDDNIKRKATEIEERINFDISSEEIGKESFTSKYPDMIWGLLGKLNASNHTPDKKENFSKFLDSISHYEFDDAYSMLSYYIHAVGASTVDKKQAVTRMRPIFESLIGGSILYLKLCDVDQRNAHAESKFAEQVVFEEHEAGKVLSFVTKWVSELENTELIIVDPYFSQEDLEFIANAIGRDPNFSIRILTSYSRLCYITQNTDLDAKDVLGNYWRDNVSTDSKPFISVVFCGLKSLKNEMPIHDRWWISGDKGLRLGGSINGIDGKRISSISKMKPEDVLPVDKKIEGYISLRQREYNGERLEYQMMSV